MRNIFLENKDKFTNEFIKGLLQNNLVPHDQNNVLYKFVSFEVAKLILSQQSLKFSSPFLFEDKMELHISNIDFTADNELLIDRLQTAYFKKYPHKSSIPYEFTHKEMIDAYRMALEEQRRTSLIFCTSISCTNKSMWRKYADRGRGVCLGFYFPTFYKPFDMTVMHVQYQDKMSLCRIFDNSQTTRSYELMRWTMTKETKYAFEDEVRCFIPSLYEPGKFPEANYCLISFDVKQLREMIFGPKVTSYQKRELKDILKKHAYDLQKIGVVSSLKCEKNVNIDYEI